MAGKFRPASLAFWSANGCVLLLAGLFWLGSGHAESVAGFAQAHVPACPMRQATGILCPGCGSTRAVLALLHQEFAAAFRFNPFLFVGGMMLLVDLGRVWAWRWRPELLANRRWLQSYAMLTKSFLVLVIAYWILRNLPPLRQWLWA